MNYENNIKSMLENKIEKWHNSIVKSSNSVAVAVQGSSLVLLIDIFAKTLPSLKLRIVTKEIRTKSLKILRQ